MKKIILSIFLIMTLMLMTTSLVSASGRFGVAVCVPGYTGDTCAYSDCYSVMDNTYSTLKECNDAHHHSEIKSLVNSFYVDKNISDEQIDSFVNEINNFASEKQISIENATQEFKIQREKIHEQLKEQMKGSLADDKKIINSFERGQNFSLNNTNVTIYSMKDTAINHVENMKEVAKTFQDKNKYKYKNFEMLPINDNNSLIIMQKPAKILFFDVNIKDKYIVDNFGSVVEQKRSFWSYIVGRK